jgi:hypothetical protein
MMDESSELGVVFEVLGFMSMGVRGGDAEGEVEGGVLDMELDIMGVVGMVVGVVMDSEESKKDSEEIKCEIQGEVTVQPRTRCTMTPITPPSYWLRIRGPSNAVTRLPRGELRRRVGGYASRYLLFTKY